jgi:hypothetical protein
MRMTLALHIFAGALGALTRAACARGDALLALARVCSAKSSGNRDRWRSAGRNDLWIAACVDVFDTPAHRVGAARLGDDQPFSVQ